MAGKRLKTTRSARPAEHPVTIDQLKVAIARLSVRIVHEAGGQTECDRLETELATLQRQLDGLLS